MNLSICVQHHPSRAHLLDRLGDLDYDLVSDPEPGSYRSALRCYVACMEAMPVEATHQLILQDDVILADDFTARVEKAVSDHPERLLALFVPGTLALGRPVEAAYRQRERYVELPRSTHFIPSVALCWPRSLAEPYLEFARARLAAGERRGAKLESDDYPVAVFCKQEGIRVVATVPSLVQHPDDEPSLFGKRHRSGANKARVAAVFHD